MARSDLHITARIVEKSDHMVCMDYYYDGKRVAYSAWSPQFGHINFTEFTKDFCNQHGIKPPAK